MDRYWITYKHQTDKKQDSVFAADVTSAINAFLTKNPAIDPTDILSVETKASQGDERRDAIDDSAVTEEESPLPPDSPKKDSGTPTPRVSRSTPADTVGNTNQQQTRDTRVALLVTACFVTSLLLVAGIWAGNMQPTVASPDTQTSTIAKSDWSDKSRQSCTSVLNEKTFNDVYVDFRAARADAQNEQAYFVPRTQNKILYRSGYQKHTRYDRAGDFKWAMVSSIDGSTFMTYEVKCEVELIKVMFGLSRDDSAEYECYEPNTQVFHTAATICQLP